MMPVSKLKEQALQPACFAICISDRKLCLYPPLQCFLVTNNGNTVKHLILINFCYRYQSMELPYNVNHVLSLILIFKNDTKVNLKQIKAT